MFGLAQRDASSPLDKPRSVIESFLTRLTGCSWLNVVPFLKVRSPSTALRGAGSLAQRDVDRSPRLLHQGLPFFCNSDMLKFRKEREGTKN